MENLLLDPKLVNNLREVINRTNIFIEDKDENSKFNQICAVMDRLDTSVKYINCHLNTPKNDDELILFIVHVCIIRDAVNYTSKILHVEEPITNIFKDIVTNNFDIKSNEYFGDDNFVEYFRALAFAHPFKTDKKIPDKMENEIQYSPYIIVNSPITLLYEDSKDYIGVIIYSNKRKMTSLFIKFDLIKEYISEKYLLLNDIIKAFNDIIENKEKEWIKKKINRHQSTEKILEEVCSTYKERYWDDYEINKLLKYYKQNSTNDKNNKIVKKYKQAIENKIENLCDAVDNLDDEKAEKILISLLSPSIDEKYQMLHYDIEKAFSYLDDDNTDSSGMLWGIGRAKHLYDNLANKWVYIDFESMSNLEIKLLITISLYYEAKNDMKGNNLNE